MSNEKTKVIYEQISAKVIEHLESIQNNKDWKKPWFSAGVDGVLPHNCATGTIYKGINLFMLGIEAIEKGYPLNRWLTFKQCTTLGGKIVKGQKHTKIYKFNPLYLDEDKKRITYEEFKQKNEAGEVVYQTGYIKTFQVFNVAQTEGLPEKYTATQKLDNLQGFQELQEPEQLINNIGAEISYVAGDNAYYNPATDSITVPLKKQFSKAGLFYPVVFHELGHWTGYKTRLDRIGVSQNKTKQDYAFEELIAELTSNYLCAFTGVNYSMENSAKYIKIWIDRIKENSQIFMKASAQAQKACDFILQEVNHEVLQLSA